MSASFADALLRPQRLALPSLGRARIELTYLFKQQRLPDLASARRFTELVQLRKLHDRDPRLPALMDKLASKKFAADTLGSEWTIPTAWSGNCLPDAAPFAFPGILKARHGCNQNYVLRSPAQPKEWKRLQRLAHKWMKQPYGFWLDEWAYKDTPRGLIAEPLITTDGNLPVDYKIYVFGGRATHIQVHLERENSHRWQLHDRHWYPLVATGDSVTRPCSLDAMLDAAEQLAHGHSFLRVDFYEVEGRPLFGEFCLYPGSGLDPFAADWIDFELGTLWRAALRG